MNQNIEILNRFEKYLENNGYSVVTPSGLKSTCHDYSHVRIPAVCNRERISVPLLINNIDRIVSKYDRFGSEAEFGNKSHRAVINALKRFKEFIDSDYFSKS